MQLHYFVTVIAPDSTVIDVVYQDDPPTTRPSDDQVLFNAYGVDPEDAKANLIAVAKSSGEALVAAAEARAEGTKLAVRELTT